jgi:hypothetical protein
MDCRAAPGSAERHANGTGGAWGSKVIAAGWCNKELPKFKGTVYVLKASRQPGRHPYFSPWSIKNGSFLQLPQVLSLVSCLTLRRLAA